ncbi:hypothetical protein At1D132_49160 (plasmid) [Agrobacterium fabrum]|nr:hypothetical protein At1D132_49160 [Agrobacterium fabrum]
MKSTRQRCQVAFSTLLTPVLMLSRASETMSFTPLKPRRVSLQELCPDGLGRGCADLQPKPSALTPTAMMAATGTIRPPRLTFRLVASIRIYHRSPSMGRSRKVLTLTSISSQSRETWLFGDATHAHGLHQVMDGTRRDALDIGLRDDGRQSLLGHTKQFEAAGEVTARPQLGIRSSTAARVSQSRLR